MKPYVFNGKQYYDLDTLAEDFIENFSLAQKDIFKNYKKFLKFVKKLGGKKLFKEVSSILAYTKYQNNALTFIIFTLLDEHKKRVVINGVELTLKDFIKGLSDYPDKENNVFFAFLEDHGISKTYANLADSDSKLTIDAYQIENNFDNPFTYKYLTTFYTFKSLESLNSQISTIAVQGEECFRRASKVCKNETFQLSLAHKIGFEKAILMHKEVNPVFYATKYLNDISETETDQLKKILTDTFYWWLLDNLDKYQVMKSDAKKTFLRLLDLKKEFQSYKDKILEKKITNISFDQIVDLSRRLYLNYINFVNLYRKGHISVRTKYPKEDYDLNKAYCNTYVCKDFVKGRVVKLYNKSENQAIKINKVKVNPLTGKEITDLEEEKTQSFENLDLDDVSDDAPLLEEVDAEDTLQDIKKKMKTQNKAISLANFAIVSFIINLILVAGFMTLLLVLKPTDGYLLEFSNLFTNKIEIIVVSSVINVLGIIFALVLKCIANSDLKRIERVLFINTSKNKKTLSLKQEAKFTKYLYSYEQDIKVLDKNYRIREAISILFQSISFSLLIITLFSIVIIFVKLNKDITTVKITLSLIASGFVSLVFSLLKKNKGVGYAILMDILTIIISSAILYLL